MSKAHKQIRFLVSGSHNQDAHSVCVVRDSWMEGDEDSLVQHYLTREGQWISYKGYDIIQAAFIIQGRDVVRNPNIRALLDELLEERQSVTKEIHDALKEGFRVRE